MMRIERIQKDSSFHINNKGYGTPLVGARTEQSWGLERVAILGIVRRRTRAYCQYCYIL